jgi:hypothetical protein
MCLAMLGVVILSDWVYPYHRPPEESLFLFVAPVVLATTGAGALMFSLTRGYPTWLTQRLAHWAGIAISFMPLAWWLFGYADGWVFPRDLFVWQVVRV